MSKFRIYKRKPGTRTFCFLADVFAETKENAEAIARVFGFESRADYNKVFELTIDALDLISSRLQRTCVIAKHDYCDASIKMRVRERFSSLKGIKELTSIYYEECCIDEYYEKVSFDEQKRSMVFFLDGMGFQAIDNDGSILLYKYEGQPKEIFKRIIIKVEETTEIASGGSKTIHKISIKDLRTKAEFAYFCETDSSDAEDDPTVNLFINNEIINSICGAEERPDE